MQAGGTNAVPVIAATVGGILGAAAAVWKRVHVLRAITSFAGACGLAVASVLLGAPIYEGYIVVGVVGVGLTGLAVQERYGRPQVHA